MREAPDRRFQRVLVANRGEIAVRVIRACHDAGMTAVAVYSDADAGALHVRLADDAVRIGPPPATESYLRVEAVLDAASATGADAVHPGYGFLAERAAFARAVTDAGLVFVGPAAATIEALGDKVGARRLARSVAVDMVPGTIDPIPVDRADALPAILVEADRIGYPLMVKASAGGGGRGMRRVERAADLPIALTAAAAEAMSAFGDGTLYLEREIEQARHVEVQVLGDETGRVVAVGERDCSIQRRHQKLVEESPAPGLTATERRRLHDAAVRIATAAGLVNVATVEFLRGADGATYFLEVNTRLQVEHGVTELVTGLDLVREQFRLAAGEALSDAVLAAADRAAEPTRHAIEVRLTAEDPSRAFTPTPGRVRHWVMPSGPGVRVDTGLGVGDRIPAEYDSLMAKLMVVGDDRTAAIAGLRRALDETEVAGVQTTLPFHRFVLNHAGFARGDLTTDWVETVWDGPAERAGVAGSAAVVAVDAVMAGTRLRHARATGDTGGTAHDPQDTGWRAAGREEAIDRWPA